MKKSLYLILAISLFVFIHEGTHIIVALIFNEYKAFQIHYFGFEVIFKTPTPARSGIKWGFISGMSNIITLLIGYLLFFYRKKIADFKSSFIRSFGYWIILIFLLFDPLNLSLIPFLFGGDIGGIVEGFGINQYLIQVAFFIILLINRELIIHKLFPLYGIKAKHPLFKSLIKHKNP